MKHFGKNSISSGLRRIIDIILVLILLSVAFIFWQVIQLLPPINDSEKAMLFLMLSQCVFSIISFLITLQIRKLINSFKRESFFELKNVKGIQTISLLLLLYVIVDIVLIQFNPNRNPVGLISEFTGNLSVLDSILSIILTINYKVLFLSAVIYVISIVFKEGYELKEQTNLTI